jgi:hypothetical protein
MALHGADGEAGRSDQQLRSAHEQFVATRAPSECVRPMVLGSWRRSAGARVGQEKSELPPLRVAADALDDYRRAHPMAVLMPMFRELLGASATEGGHIWAISDADGTLLWVEGELAALRKAERMNFVPGAAWGEAQAGTNAPGTALELGQAVRIVGAEHYKSAVQRWSCAAAPLRDPDSGELLGTIDLTGDRRMGSDEALIAVTATARAAEAELARRLAVADGLARERYLQCLEHAGEPLALVAPSGRVLHASRGIKARRLTDLAPGTSRLLDGRQVVVEPVDDTGYLLVRADETAPLRTGARRAPLRLHALGTDIAELRLNDRVERLSPRHSEIVVALVLARCGVTGERLGFDLYGDDIHAVTLRVEMLRLRAVLGADVLGSRPYELRGAMRADFDLVRDLLAAGRLPEALDAYCGPLLPSSEAPTIVEYRTVLEQQLRAAVLSSGQPVLLRRWVDAPWGADDRFAWESLAHALPAGSAQQAAAIARAGSLV